MDYAYFRPNVTSYWSSAIHSYDQQPYSAFTSAVTATAVTADAAVTATASTATTPTAGEPGVIFKCHLTLQSIVHLSEHLFQCRCVSLYTHFNPHASSDRD